VQAGPVRLEALRQPVTFVHRSPLVMIGHNTLSDGTRSM